MMMTVMILSYSLLLEFKIIPAMFFFKGIYITCARIDKQFLPYTAVLITYTNEM